MIHAFKSRAAVAILAASSVFAANAADITGAGASFIYPVMSKWSADYSTATGNKVNYQSIGSGGGIAQIKAKTVDFGSSDAPLKPEDLAAAGLAQFPSVIGGVVPVVNVAGIAPGALKLDGAVLANIFLGKIKTWNDPAIAALNEGVELPDLAISPVHRSDPSGTQETFTTYLNSVAPDVWTYEPSDEWPLDGGEAGQGTSGVIQAISGGQGTIGFADASQVGDLGQVHVEVDGEFVPYSAEAASALVENSPLAEGRGEADLVFEVDPASATGGAYPIALVSYLIGCTEYEDPEVATLVKEYFTYVTSAEGQDAAAEAAGSAPISDSLREQITAAIDLIQVD